MSRHSNQIVLSQKNLTISHKSTITLPVRGDTGPLDVWKVIRIGTHASKLDLYNAVINEGHRISNRAQAVVDDSSFSLQTAERDMKLFTATVSELGFPDGASASAVYFRLCQLGYGLCPDETALQLRRVYTDQPTNEQRYVVSEPIGKDGSGQRYILGVERRGNKTSISGLYAGPVNFADVSESISDLWLGHISLVFCLTSSW